jgi:hypothetical protein
MSKEYGGYLPLELPRDAGHYYFANASQSVLKLNCGRTTFYCAALDSGMKKVHLPYFTCEDTRSPFDELGIEVVEYFIDDSFLPKVTDYSQEDYVLWTNYYGNSSREVIDVVVKTYPKLIIDNCHAFFSQPIEGVYNCYSTRKFFGVSDGAYLINTSLSSFDQLPIDQSTIHAQHLIDQIESGTNSGYLVSLSNEERLFGNYKKMSRFTDKLLNTIDYEDIKAKRRENFLTYHETLQHLNSFPINLKSETHYYYPFLFEQENLRYKLIEKRVYNPQWWKHLLDKLPETSFEHQLTKFTVLLPLDQRYECQDIQDVCEILFNCIEGSL